MLLADRVVPGADEALTELERAHRWSVGAAHHEILETAPTKSNRKTFAEVLSSMPEVGIALQPQRIVVSAGRMLDTASLKAGSSVVATVVAGSAITRQAPPDKISQGWKRVLYAIFRLSATQ
jgi:hypothetical protein